MAFSESEHSFLTGILSAVKSENVGRSYRIFDEEFSLEFGLGEIFKKDSRCCLVRKSVNECLSLEFFILVRKVRVFTEEL